MPDSPRSLRVAILQTSPAAGDAAQSIRKLGDLAADAARRGVGLVAVGETWLPGYPAWIDHCPGSLLWGEPTTKAEFARYRAASVAVGGELDRMLAEVARATGVVLVVGCSERVDQGPGHATLYNSLLTYDATGRLVNHHRKLVPTYTERCIWGPGDADGLRAVQTAAGRVGGLVCWEHWMPLARQALHESREQIHVAVWPWVHEMHQIASRQYAFEARCFVLAVGQIQRAGQHLPAGMARREGLHTDDIILRGGSAIIAPDGSYLAGPVLDEETTIIADIDLSLIDREAMTLDVTGHYSRPDLFTFNVRHGTRRAAEPETT